MPNFGKTSMSNLRTCQRDIQTVLLEAIKISEVDFSVIFGHRSPEIQFELYQKGRKLMDNDKWIIEDQKKVVTFKDGFQNLSRHNLEPSQAVDIMPYFPKKEIDPWSEKGVPHFIYLAGLIMGLSSYFKAQELVQRELIWGANWDNDGILIYDHTLADFPHFQLK